MIKSPKMFEDARCLRGPEKIGIQILIFIAVFIVCMLVEALFSSIYIVPEMFNYLAEKNISVTDPGYMDAVYDFSARDDVMIVTLFTTLAATILTVIYCRCIEYRPLKSMGIKKNNAFKHYFIGIAVGLVLMSIIVGVQYAFGAIDVEGVSFDLNYKIYVLYLIGFLIQGMSEEFLFRGYFMNTLGALGKPLTAIIISSCAFAAAHLANPGVSVLAVVNLILFGAFAGVWMMATDNIWGVCGIHSMWNFAQGNIFGISVSGAGTGETLIDSKLNDNLSIVNGGDFGIEGGIVTTVVLAAAIIGVIFYSKKKNSQQQEITVENV